MISPIVYGPIVLFLLASHWLSIYFMERRIRDLKCALVARNALLGEDQHVVTKTGQGSFNVGAGDSIVFRFKVVPGSFEIASSSATTITYTARS